MTESRRDYSAKRTLQFAAVLGTLISTIGVGAALYIADLPVWAAILGGFGMMQAEIVTWAIVFKAREREGIDPPR